MEDGYNKSLDVAKGIAIILVVLGHSLTGDIFNSDTIIDVAANIIFDFVYSFHMPVFFAISGYLFYNAWNLSRRGTIKKKALRLLIPYITFSVIYIPLRMIASAMAYSTYDSQYWKILFGISPNGGVWYLYTLFIFMLGTFYCVKPDKLHIFLITAFLLSVVFQLGFSFSDVIHNAAPRLLDVCRFYCYFLLGLYVKKNSRLEKVIAQDKFIPAEFCFFIILFVLKEIFALLFLTVPVALLGVLLTIQFSRKIKHSAALAWLGANSMDIYLLHGPVAVVLRTLLIRGGVNKICIAVGLFAGGILISALISKFILHRFKIIQFLCTGVWRKA